MNISISKEDMITLLEKSFEEGYNGYLDMKKDSASSIFEEHINKLNIQKPNCFPRSENILSSEGWVNISLPNNINNYGRELDPGVWITTNSFGLVTSSANSNNSSNITLTTNS